MGIINVLDKHVAELIAAGEVVERPASVIKELVENAVDAKAKHITVEIKRGGITFMRVADDGCGIMREDVRTAFLRHATSKVISEQDLNSISTLGFRGEALASICAVSRLQLLTRNENEDNGTCYIIEGGEELSLDDAGCPTGTTFIIRDLFYNIPARAKFLKKDVSEGNAVANIMDKTALSHPEIAFTFIRDGKQIFKTYGDGKLMSAIYAVYGKDFASGLMPVDYELGAVRVNGYVSKPVHSRANRNMQNFFINGRYVKSRTAMAALEEAFKGSIMVGKFPSCVLNLEMPYDLTDVNVHPAKIEVRFVNERPVFEAVYHAVKSSLMQNDSKKQAQFRQDNTFRSNSFNPFNNAQAILGKAEPPEKKPQSKPEKDSFEPFDLPERRETPPIKKPSGIDLDNLSLSDSSQPFGIFTRDAVRAQKAADKFANQSRQPLFLNDAPKKQESVEERPLFADDIQAETAADTSAVKNEAAASVAAETEPREFVPVHEEPVVTLKENSQPALIESTDELRYIGELFDTYIIVEVNRKEMMLIDKHAAHERIIYEDLKAKKAGADTQLLLQPVTVTLGKDEYDAAINHLDMFEACSFEVEDFGNGTVIVRGAPQYIDAAEIENCIVEMANHISMGKNDIFSEKMDWFYHNVACRSAIKAGNKNSARELISIVKTLQERPEIRYCPHGRPICVMMSKSAIEKQFGRA